MISTKVPQALWTLPNHQEQLWEESLIPSLLANLKRGGHTLVFIFSSCRFGCLALCIQGRLDFLFDEMAQLSLHQML